MTIISRSAPLAARQRLMNRKLTDKEVGDPVAVARLLRAAPAYSDARLRWVMDAAADWLDARRTEVGAKRAVRALIEYLGEDPEREGLLDTPKRVVAAWDEMTSGYGEDPATILATDFHGNGYDQMATCTNVSFYSTCEHHMLPFFGEAFVAYIPRHRVVGLSKLARLVGCFAKRLQIQECMTQEIADAMWKVLKPKGVGVMIRAKHLCMACRGVKQDKADFVTTALKGAFKQHKVREEFYFHCK